MFDKELNWFADCDATESVELKITNAWVKEVDRIVRKSNEAEADDVENFWGMTFSIDAGFMSHMGKQTYAFGDLNEQEIIEAYASLFSYHI
jgi:hypothetical protein